MTSAKKAMLVALYIRVSTEEQAAHGYSLEAQRDALEDYCKAHGLAVYDIYADEGISARKPVSKRPEMCRLLEDAKAGCFGMVLFIKLDRWFRNVADYYSVQKILDEHSIIWRATQEDYCTDTADGRLKVNIMLSVAENEADRTSERIRFVFENRRKKGDIAGGFTRAPWGYQLARVDGRRTLIKDPEAEPAVAEFWRLALAYNSTRRAGKEIGDRWPQYAKPYHYWLHVANDPVYAGIYHDQEGFFPAYLPADTWRQYTSSRKTRQDRTGRVYLFSGLLRCPVCGCRLSCTYKEYKDKLYVSYRCRNVGKGGCSFRSYISEMVVETWLRENILSEVDRLETETAAKARQVVVPAISVPKLEEQLRRLGVVYTTGTMSDEEYLQAAADLRRRIADAKKQEPAPLPDLSALRATLASGALGIYAELSREERQRFWRSIISEIHLSGHSVDHVVFRV